MRREYCQELKKIRRYTMVFIASMLTCFAPTISSAETINGTASVTIKELVQVSETQAMDFGTIYVQSGQAQTITVGTDGTLSTGENGQSGIFAATGVPNSAITISFSNSELRAGAETLPLKNFTHDAGASPKFNSSGALEFKIGADIEISQNQAAGTYTGTYQLSVNYQ